MFWCEVQSPVKNRYLTFDVLLYNCQLLSLGSAVVLFEGHRICDSRVTVLRAGWAPLHSGVGQATYTYVPLSPNIVTLVCTS